MSQTQYSDADDDEECDDYDADYDSYYQEDCFDMDSEEACGDNGGLSHYAVDLESFDFKLLNTEDVERLLNEGVAQLQSQLQISPSLAKVLLHRHAWSADDIQKRYKANSDKLLCESQLLPTSPPLLQQTEESDLICAVCLCPAAKLVTARCGHRFCADCWSQHIETLVQEGRSTDIECMAVDCNVILPEDMVLDLITKSQIREKYQRFAFEDYVNMHPSLRFCPGPGCLTVAHAKEKKARKVVCSHCNSIYCFRCGIDYHAPTSCEIIKKWLIKCIDDSETANYISAHTKDCPRCHVCIEKNGGCNHIQCFKCKYDFCWMCLGDWKSHSGEYYECSKYKENSQIGTPDATHQAREALLKYLHYFTRWENHSNSLKLEAKEKRDIHCKIESKVLARQGTWIDWQYLLDATELLQRCRYTLKYTYPYAYYLHDDDCRKHLFEYQQGKLEAEVENLSWKIQKAEITDRGDLENQMDVGEKMRQTLLKDFLQS